MAFAALTQNYERNKSDATAAGNAATTASGTVSVLA
jgi:hypothetical protein